MGDRIFNVEIAVEISPGTRLYCVGLILVLFLMVAIFEALFSGQKVPFHQGNSALHPLSEPALR